MIFNFLRTIFGTLHTLLCPIYWLRNYGTNRALDDWMREALKDPEFCQYTEYTVVLNGKRLWVSNYPYAYGGLHNRNNLGLPSRQTTRELRKAVNKFVVESA